MNNVTITQSVATSMIAAGINLAEAFGGADLTIVADGVPTVETPAAKDGRNHAARKHNFEARIARRENTKMGGLTKAERSELYKANPGLSAMSATKRAAEWKKIVAAYKAAN
jgi:hypothetical protein